MADKRTGVSRRDILRGAGAAALIGAVSGVEAQERPGSLARVGPGAARIPLTVNGRPTVFDVEPRVTLLDALRDRAGLTGTKRICDRGACGGCTVWVDGKTVNSCMMLAIDAAGASVTTVEGLAKGGRLHAVQAAFIKHDALQCGFCTPGMIMSCAALVASNKNPTHAEIRDAVSGNLCRCGTYPHVFQAVKEATR
ncbi:MAG: (2Fe-2S)-binding protein [Planctomycetota bacterium]|jgi:aerobic-type carbon monoxide dehydrogenase small subunit (CoxS/CutS family)